MGKNKKKKALKKAKKFTKEVLVSDPAILGHEWNPVVNKKLKAFSLESKAPIGGGEYHHSYMSIVAWENGEGYDVILSDDKCDSQLIPMHMDDINLLLKGLEKMGYFEFDKEELKNG